MELKDYEVEQIDIDDGPWIKDLNAQWDAHFEQREAPTE